MCCQHSLFLERLSSPVRIRPPPLFTAKFRSNLIVNCNHLGLTPPEVQLSNRQIPHPTSGLHPPNPQGCPTKTVAYSPGFRTNPASFEFSAERNALWLAVSGNPAGARNSAWTLPKLSLGLLPEKNIQQHRPGASLCNKTCL